MNRRKTISLENDIKKLEMKIRKNELEMEIRRNELKIIYLKSLLSDKKLELEMEQRGLNF